MSLKIAGTQIECLRERLRCARNPKNGQRVRLSVLQSPTRSAHKHASTFGFSDRTVRRIIHIDLKFRQYKYRLFMNCQNSTGKIRRHSVTIPYKMFLQILFFSQVMKLTFITLAASINRILATGRVITLDSFMKNIYTSNE